MFILISPAKIMKDIRTHDAKQLPMFLEQAREIHKELHSYDIAQLQALMNINEKIATLTYERFQSMRFDEHGVCALDAYDGLQYKSMDMSTMSTTSWAYLDQHLRILSGFYGMLKPSDSIYPYRLEMQTSVSIEGCGQLYSYWMDRMANALKQERKKHSMPYVINLASKEYDRCCRSYFLDDTFIDMVFLVKQKGVYKTMSTQAKKARGQMVRWMADHQCEDIHELKAFDVDGYHYDEFQSTTTCFVYVKASS